MVFHQHSVTSRGRSVEQSIEPLDEVAAVWSMEQLGVHSIASEATEEAATTRHRLDGVN